MKITDQPRKKGKGWRAAPAHKRLLGWMRRRFQTAPGTIWHQLDLAEFCEFCGLSERTGRYAVQRLREDQEDHGLKFRTVFKRDNGPRGSWVILYANASELLFDCEPLFRTEGGRTRHIRPKLTEGEIRPPEPSTAESPGRGAVGWPVREVPATPNRGRDYYVVSAGTNKHGPRPENRRFRHRWRTKPISEHGLKRLRGKAYAITRRIGGLWWDNCKVIGPAECSTTRRAVAGFVLKSLRAGHQEKAIAGAVELALGRLHATATDRGELFNASSTIARAVAILEADVRTEEQRAVEFYQDRWESWAEIRQRPILAA